jgi:hypothetical protein
VDAREAASVRIERVRDRRGLRRFASLPASLYADDPSWVPPLLLERMEHLDPNKNPFFEHAEVNFWLAWQHDRCVGRVSAQVDRAHLERHKDATGHFGFLEATDDAQVFEALLGTAEDWLAHRGMKQVRGPFSLSINDECGLLVDGFEHPPYVMMGHARPYHAKHLEERGYGKAKDLIAYLYDLRAPLPKAADATVKRLDKEAALSFRRLDMRHFEREVRTVVEVFNDAWSDNWGFVPFSEAELGHLARNLRLLIRPGFVSIAEIDGEPAAVAVSLPNLNEAIADLGGRLLPFGWAKLLWRLKVRGTRTARVPLMGVRRRYQASALGMALAMGVIDRVRREHVARGTQEAELSWILEDNVAVRRIIEMMGARPYKRYRIYQKSVA